MTYLVTNITDSTPDPKLIHIGDIPNRGRVSIQPGATIDLEVVSTRNQILDSVELKVHLAEGRVTADTLGTRPRDRIFVDAEVNQINVPNISVSEPLQISALVGGTEVSLTGTAEDGHVSLDVIETLPSKPFVDNIAVITANSEFSYTLPIDSKRFLVKVREGDTIMHLAFQSGGDYVTVRKGVALVEEKVNADNLTLYLKVDKAPRTIEILSWGYGP